MDDPPSDRPAAAAVPIPEQERPLLPFLPMVYVAWADGELTGAEIAAISERVDRFPELGQACRERLARWLDPGRPPTPRQLVRMLAVIRAAAAGLGEPRRRSLAELGLELARLGERPGERLAGPEVERALAEIEEALGVVGHEAVAALVAPGRRPAAPAEEPPAFDREAMRRLLDGDHHELRLRVRELLADPAFRFPPRLPTADYRERVTAACRLLAGRGLGALGFPPETGGGGDLGAFIAAFETLAYGDLSVVVKFGVQFGLFGGSIYQLGTERHHRELLGAVGTMQLPGCFAMSETGHGSNVHDLETVARWDGATGELVIDTPRPEARKDWIGNAARDGRMATVFAQLEVDGERHGVHAVLVPIRDAAGQALGGVDIEDCGEKEGLHGVDNGRLSFAGVRVPRTNLLDRFGAIDAEGRYTSPIPGDARRFFTMLGTLVGGRISVAAAALSAAKTGLAIAVRYGARRRQFGPPGEPEVPILDYLAHQRRLMPRLATAYALDFALAHLVERYLARTEEDSREVEALAAGLKAFSTWSTVDTLQTCRECCGGQGYLAVNRFARLKADTDVFTTFEGDNTVLMQLAAKGALTAYRRQFGEMRALAVARLLAERAATRLTELNPVVTRKTDEEHLRDPGFQLAALRYREDRLTASAARRIKRRIDDGMDSFAAFDEVQDHLLALARARVERVIAERFREAIAGVGDRSLAGRLTELADLFALWHLERDSGWFQEAGYVEGSKAAAIRALVNRLCRAVRRQAVPLVDAFGIPDAVLAAPIAT